MDWNQIWMMAWCNYSKDTDKVTGQSVWPRTRYLGSRGPRMRNVDVLTWPVHSPPIITAPTDM